MSSKIVQKRGDVLTFENYYRYSNTYYVYQKFSGSKLGLFTIIFSKNLPNL